MSAGRCPVGCGRSVEFDKLVCGVCWGRVPQALQRKVYSTWRARRRGPASERAGLRYDYDTARDDAIASVR